MLVIHALITASSPGNANHQRGKPFTHPHTKQKKKNIIMTANEIIHQAWKISYRTVAAPQARNGAAPRQASFQVAGETTLNEFTGVLFILPPYSRSIVELERDIAPPKPLGLLLKRWQPERGYF
jgi:hypothetical protein